jgi:hypothetical protein
MPALLRRLDRALYAAKEAGRDCVRLAPGTGEGPATAAGATSVEPLPAAQPRETSTLD